MDKIKIMISSKVKGMEEERSIINKMYENNSIFELVGAAPYTSSSQATSSALETTKIAHDCDLYILLLGKEFGMETEDGRSATEIEFDEAYRQNPTKILVFLKDENIRNKKQKAFVDKVCNYYRGYWRSTYKFASELQDLIETSVITWLKNRASFGKNITYIELFVHQAIALNPDSNFKVYYKVSVDTVEIEYYGLNHTKIFQFEVKDIYSNFWENIYCIKIGIDRWLKDEVYK